MIEEVVFILIVGMVGGYFSMLVGMGIGSMTVPALVLYGIDPRVAIGSSLVQDVAVCTFGGGWHYKLGHVRLDVLIPLGAAAIVGTVVGANISARLLPLGVLKALVGGAIVAVGLFVALKSLGNRTGLKPEGKSSSVALIALIGLVAGLLYGMIGGGWGPLTVLPLIVAGTVSHSAVGTSTIARPLVALIGSFIYIGVIGFRPEIVIPLIAGGLITAPFGATTTKKFSAKTLSRVVGIVSTLLGMSVLLGLVI